MFCGWLFLILPLFCSAASTKPSVYIPKKVDDKPRNTPIDFDGQKWKFKLTNAAQLSAYFISKSPAAVSFDLDVPDPSKLTKHTKIEFDFESGQKIVLKIQQDPNGQSFILYDGYGKNLFGSNKPVVSITVFTNGTAFFETGEKNLPINLKIMIPFFDIGNSTFASGFTLTGTNIADFLEIHFKPGIIGFDKNLDPKQPVADAFVGSIGFYVVVVVGVLIVLGLISGFFGWRSWRKRKMEKRKILIEDKKSPNNDGKKELESKSIRKLEEGVANDKPPETTKETEQKPKVEQKNKENELFTVRAVDVQFMKSKKFISHIEQPAADRTLMDIPSIQ